MMGGGGGGGAGYIPRSDEKLLRKVQIARQKEEERLVGDIDNFISNKLAKFNQRGTEEIQDFLEDVEDILKDQAEGFVQFLFGGSVAKHTYVDGYSDIDALVILNRADLGGKSPGIVLNAFYKTLKDQLLSDKVATVEKGKLAVTIKLRDGNEVQLLPALRSRNKVLIADTSGQKWNETQPKTFQRELTKANQRLNGALIPSIKLMKSIVYDFPEQKQLKSHHIEALALDAEKGYKGGNSPRELLTHILNQASRRVLSPIADVTGQSRTVDAYLGKANSIERRNISDALAGVRRRLELATSVNQWKAILNDGD